MNKFILLCDHIMGHCYDSITRALSAERHPLSQRLCPELSDTDFVRLGVLRVISVVDSSRHFLQNNKDLYCDLIAHSTYFKSLKSTKRTQMLEAVKYRAMRYSASSWHHKTLTTSNNFPNAMITE